MNPFNSFLHEKQNYRFEGIFQGSTLILCLICKAQFKLWKGIFTYHQLPAPLTNSITNLKDLLPLFKQQSNFEINYKTGTIILLLRSNGGNENMETPVPIQLNQISLKTSVQPEPVEVKEQVRNLKFAVKILEEKMMKMEHKNFSHFFETTVNENYLEGEEMRVEAALGAEKNIQRLQERVREAEAEIRKIKEVLKLEPSEEDKKIRRLRSREEDIQEVQNSKLNLNDKKLGDEGIKYLEEKKYTATLVELRLANNKITDVGLASLGKNTWNKLQLLSLRGNYINDKGISNLKNFPHLESLWIVECGVTTEGVKNLSQFQLPLKQLYLGNNEIKDEGVKYMNKFPNLTHLGLSSSKITEAGVEALSQMCFSQLSWLYLNENEIGSKGKAIIQKWKKQKHTLIYYDE